MRTARGCLDGALWSAVVRGLGCTVGCTGQSAGQPRRPPLRPSTDVTNHAPDRLHDFFGPFLVYCVASVREHDMLPAGSTGDQRLVVAGPDPALLLGPACRRAEHDDRHIREDTF